MEISCKYLHKLLIFLLANDMITMCNYVGNRFRGGIKMKTGVSNDKLTSMKVRRDPIDFYLNGSKIITILTTALMFLPWLSISVRDGSKGSYFLFEFKRFLANVTEFTDVDEFDYSVLMFLIPIVLYLIAIPTLFRFWYLVITKKSVKNTYLAMKKYCQLGMFSSVLFILTELIMTYVARNEILIQNQGDKVPFGYNPVTITIIPILMCVLCFTGQYLFNIRYYDEVCYRMNAEYIIYPKEEEPMNYMKKSTFYQSITFCFYLVAMIPMVLRAIYLVDFCFGSKKPRFDSWVGGFVVTSSYESNTLELLQMMIAIISLLPLLLAVRAMIRYVFELISRRNRFHIAVAFHNTMGLFAFSGFLSMVGTWILQLFAKLSLFGLSKEVNAGLRIPTTITVVFLVCFVGYFVISQLYYAEVCCEEGIPIDKVSRKYEN